MEPKTADDFIREIFNSEYCALMWRVYETFLWPTYDRKTFDQTARLFARFAIRCPEEYFDFLSYKRVLDQFGDDQLERYIRIFDNLLAQSTQTGHVSA